MRLMQRIENFIYLKYEAILYLYIDFSSKILQIMLREFYTLVNEYIDECLFQCRSSPAPSYFNCRSVLTEYSESMVEKLSGFAIFWFIHGILVG